MAKEILPVDFKDDIMNETMEGRRRYRIIQNSDGTVSFEDATEYDQLGSEFGQGQINKTNQAVNESLDKGRVIDSLEEIISNSETGYVMGALAGKKINQNVSDLNSELSALNDDGAIQGMDAREDGVYITYTPVAGADTVTKKLGSEPIVLTGTINDMGGSVTIPAGLTFVCAGITGTSGCTGYDDRAEAHMWTVSTGWSYNKSNGVVRFDVGIGGGRYKGANPQINYKIMYIPL